MADVLDRQAQIASIAATDMDCAVVCAGHLGEIAVEDAEVVPVLQCEDAIAKAEALLVDDGDEPPELAICLEQRVSASVEVADVASVDSAQQDIATVVSVRPP